MDNEKYADELDRASMIQERLNEEALETVKRRNQPETHPDFDGATCIECGDDLPQVRLGLGKIRCVACQSVREAKHRNSGAYYD